MWAWTDYPLFCEEMKGRLQVVSGTAMWELNCMSGTGRPTATEVPHHHGAFVVLDIKNRVQ